ncbi:hypothetical protein [uncultured Shewanella sp.]|uniref:hypothetical protein n=1 Tax=uncultured Shewanella sp. TaxID=173975 RepID=UPI00261ED69F|nr:hypothetical protein [uncultured Shewanella sp.]
MTDKLKNIKENDIKLNEDGAVEISDELQDVIAGGVNPEAQEQEDECLNIGCHVN